MTSSAESPLRWLRTAVNGAGCRLLAGQYSPRCVLWLPVHGGLAGGSMVETPFYGAGGCGLRGLAAGR